MITLPKIKLNNRVSRFRQALQQLERDCLILNRWSKMSKSRQVTRMSILMLDSLEQTKSELLDLQEQMNVVTH